MWRKVSYKGNHRRWWRGHAKNPRRNAGTTGTPKKVAGASPSPVNVLLRGKARGGAAGDVAEGHRRADVDAAGGVEATHHIGGVGPGGEEARDRIARS